MDEIGCTLYTHRRKSLRGLGTHLSKSGTGRWTVKIVIKFKKAFAVTKTKKN